MEKTCREKTYGNIFWRRGVMEGYQEIRWNRPGLSWTEVGVRPDGYVSPDLRYFAVTLADGRVVATDEALAALQALTPCRYALDWQEEAPFMYVHRG